MNIPGAFNKHNILQSNESNRSKEKPVLIPESKVVRHYTGDLTDAEKAELTASYTSENILEITFNQHPSFGLSVRGQNIFDSLAQVIVNAANTHLGGGGGIDGAIHMQGGEMYVQAHYELKLLYKSEYVSGHAAMISSGLLNKKYNIENVIVVAGPQGDTTPEKEDALYSCYYNSLILAHSQNKKSIAFPAISTGIYGFPKDRAAAIFLKAVKDYLTKHQNSELKVSIHFLADAKANLDIYVSAATGQVVKPSRPESD